MASNGITTRRNACQMFGIYRSRTPEKMELKPNKQTRACFLTAVITGVTLVVGLSLLDVSTNASNTKLAPVLQLKRHRQDILFENNTNINVDNISIFNGIVKEVTKIPVEKTTYTINTATTMGTTTTSTQSDLKADISQRTARTQLFPVESLKMNRNSIVKDYFIDGRHDPKSLGYYILQKQNGEYYLRNHSEPVWGTRIQRRFSNRIYPTQPDYGYKNFNNDNVKYIKRTDNLYYETNNHQKIKHNEEVKRNTDHVFHLSPFRRLSSTKIDEINTRIQNNNYQNKDTTVNDENQLPPYQFTPIPLFSNSYAQLDPYKNNANVKSVQDVMKYLTVPPKISRSSTTSMPRMVRTESTFIETTVKPENISNPNNNNNKKRKKGIRFSGTYQMPIEPEDLKTGGSGLIETLLPPPIPTPFAKPYSGNIGTLINDPFAKFRPSDPAEINHQLSPISSVLKNTSNKQKEIGSMFRNNIATSTIPPNRFFPKPPFGTRKRPRPVNTNVTPSTTNNGHNVAVYKPVPQNDNMYYKENNNNNYGTPSLNMRPPHQNIKRKRKPVSVTLDIYPITMDYDQDNSPSDNKNNVKNPSIGKFKNGDSELEWISPTMLSNDDQDSDDTSSSNNDSHMVVHLNLFPKGITRKQRSRTGRRPVWNNSETPRSMFTQKSVDDTVDFPSSYEEYFTSKTNNEREEMNKNVNKEYMDYDFEEIPEDEIPVYLYDEVPENSTAINNKKNYINLYTLSKLSEHFIETKNKSSSEFKNNNNSKNDESINLNHQMETSFSNRKIIQSENIYSRQNSENGFNNTTDKNTLPKYSNANLSPKSLTIQNGTENSYDNYYDYAEIEQS